MAGMMAARAYHSSKQKKMQMQHSDVSAPRHPAKRGQANSHSRGAPGALSQSPNLAA